MGKIENYVKWALDIAADDRHGYSQAVRWSPDYDCSSFVISALEAAGLPMRAYGATYTGNMGAALKACGFYRVKNVDLSSGAGLVRGDILLNPVTHTEIYIGDGRTAGAHGSETGGKYGKAGDQTGNEISVQPYRNKNYKEVWRYGGHTLAFDPAASNNPYKGIAQLVIRGDFGNGEDRIKALQKAGYSIGKINQIQQTVNYMLRG
jgi:hypothetical protein